MPRSGRQESEETRERNEDRTQRRERRGSVSENTGLVVDRIRQIARENSEVESTMPSLTDEQFGIFMEALRAGAAIAAPVAAPPQRSIPPKTQDLFHPNFEDKNQPDYSQNVLATVERWSERWDAFVQGNVPVSDKIKFFVQLMELATSKVYQDAIAVAPLTDHEKEFFLESHRPPGSLNKTFQSRIHSIFATTQRYMLNYQRFLYIRGDKSKILPLDLLTALNTLQLNAFGATGKFTIYESDMYKIIEARTPDSIRISEAGETIDNKYQAYQKDNTQPVCSLREYATRLNELAIKRAANSADGNILFTNGDYLSTVDKALSTNQVNFAETHLNENRPEDAAFISEEFSEYFQQGLSVANKTYAVSSPIKFGDLSSGRSSAPDAIMDTCNVGYDSDGDYTDDDTEVCFMTNLNRAVGNDNRMGKKMSYPSRKIECWGCGKPGVIVSQCDTCSPKHPQISKHFSSGRQNFAKKNNINFKSNKFRRDRSANGYKGFNKFRPRRRFFKGRAANGFDFKTKSRAHFSNSDVSNIEELHDPDELDSLQDGSIIFFLNDDQLYPLAFVALV